MPNYLSYFTNDLQQQINLADQLTDLQNKVGITPAGQPSIVEQLADIATQFINVKLPPVPMVAAKGDYVSNTQLGTNDTSAIQAVIDYADTNNKSVFIPRDYYRIDGGLNLRKNTVIFSDRATLFYNNTTGACINSIGNSISDYLSPRVKGLIVKSVPYNQTAKGMYLESTVFGVFEDCDFYGFDYGVYHSINVNNKWAYLNTFTKCRVTDNNYGFKLDSQSNGVNLDKCYIFGNKKIGVWMVNADSSRIVNSEVESNGNQTGGHGVFIDGGDANVISSNYMENNGFNDPNSAAILLDGTDLTLYTPENVGTKIVNNQLTPTGIHTTIKALNARGFTITGNTFFESNPPTYDIDISNVTNLDHSFINGNVPSLNGVINAKPNASTSTIQHGITAIPKLAAIIPILTNYTNLVSNGSFESGSTGWTLDAGVTLSTEQIQLGTQSVKIVSAGAVFAHQGVTAPSAHKYYVMGYGYIVTAGTQQLIMQFNGQNIYFNSAITNKWQKVSGIITTNSANPPLYAGAASSGVTAYLDGLMIVDLTALFGAGNEPTQAWCDMNLSFK